MHFNESLNPNLISTINNLFLFAFVKYQLSHIGFSCKVTFNVSLSFFFLLLFHSRSVERRKDMISEKTKITAFLILNLKSP